MTLREKIEVMEAFERGEEIEVSYVNKEKWSDISNPDWSWGAYNYRIKPKSKQTIIIEKWLCSWLCSFDQDSFYVIQGTKEFMSSRSEKVKLLDTYEVEL